MTTASHAAVDLDADRRTPDTGQTDAIEWRFAVATKSWTVQITLDEQDGTTRADAALDLGAHEPVHGNGTALRNPKDEEDHKIGDELAAARALSDLAHKLLDLAARDIESHTHHPAALRL